MTGLIVVLLIAWVGGISHMKEKEGGNMFNHVIFPITFVLSGAMVILGLLTGLADRAKPNSIM